MGRISNLKGIKRGTVLIYNGEPCRVVEAKFLRMQARKPVMQTKMKSLSSDKTYEYNFKQGETIETADLDRTSANFLYKQGDDAVFMDNTSYEQITIDPETLGDAANFLSEGVTADLLYWNGDIVSISLPPKVDLMVTESEPGAKGDTAQGSGTKPATLETGYTIQVPIFINQGEKIRINTETGEYDSRVTK